MNSKFLELFQAVKSAKISEGMLWSELDPEKTYQVLMKLKEFCKCDKFEDAVNFVMYLEEDLKQEFYKLRRLYELKLSGYISISVDDMFMYLEDDSSKPKPFKEDFFWSFIMAIISLKGGI